MTLNTHRGVHGKVPAKKQTNTHTNTHTSAQKYSDITLIPFDDSNEDDVGNTDYSEKW